jgi:hypothetical protein
MEQPIRIRLSREPWNKGKLVGQKAPLKLKEIWAIRVRFADFQPRSGLGVIRPGDRQQAAGLRSGEASRSRRVAWRAQACDFS